MSLEDSKLFLEIICVMVCLGMHLYPCHHISVVPIPNGTATPYERVSPLLFSGYHSHHAAEILYTAKLIKDIRQLRYCEVAS